MKSFLAAVQFLTVFPVRCSFDEAVLGRSIPFFPLVGVVIGLIAAAAAWALQTLGAPHLPSAVALAWLLAAPTGGLHLDGLADTADGFMSARPRERILEIMRDSRIGTMGVLALVFVLGMKFACLVELSSLRLPLALFLAPVAGRAMQVLLLVSLPYARHGGLANVFLPYRRTWHAIGSVLLLLGLAVGCLGPWGALLAVACVSVTAWFGRRCQRTIGGFTGDTLGAISEMTEALVLALCTLLPAGKGLLG